MVRIAVVVSTIVYLTSYLLYLIRPRLLKIEDLNGLWVQQPPLGSLSVAPNKTRRPPHASTTLLIAVTCVQGKRYPSLYEVAATSNEEIFWLRGCSRWRFVKLEAMGAVPFVPLSNSSTPLIP